MASQQLIAFPGTVVGGVSINDTNSFLGAGALLTHNLCCMTCCDPCCDDGCGQSCFRGQNCCRIDALAGFQYYNLTNNLNITENLTSTSTTSGVPVGTMIKVNDSFRTQNNFYGGALGLVLNRYRGRWVHQLQGLVSLGTNAERISINGNTTVSFPGSPTSVSPGGLYALSEQHRKLHAQQFHRDPADIGPAGLPLDRADHRLRGLYVHLLGPGGDGRQPDQSNDQHQLDSASPGGGPNQPAFTLHEARFWAQGITLGGQFNF